VKIRATFAHFLNTAPVLAEFNKNFQLMAILTLIILQNQCVLSIENALSSLIKIKHYVAIDVTHFKLNVV
jgi:hypothetical protein